MGRELRKVIPHWQHPQKDCPNYRTGRMEPNYVAMHDRPYIEAITEWIEGHQKWERGEHEAQQGENLGVREEYPHFANYEGDAPRVEYYRPNWKPEEMTWYQVYETVSEGTPVTPPFATKEELIAYLVANGDFWDQSRRKEGTSGMNCEPWSQAAAAERFVNGTGWAPSLIATGGLLHRGVDV